MNSQLHFRPVVIPVSGNRRNVLAPFQACALGDRGPVPREHSVSGKWLYLASPVMGEAQGQDHLQSCALSSDLATPSQSLVGLEQLRQRSQFKAGVRKRGVKQGRDDSQSIQVQWPLRTTEAVFCWGNNGKQIIYLGVIPPEARKLDV